MLAYNPGLNEVEWILVRGTTSDLLQAEERLAHVLANLILHPIGEEEQLKFRECRGMEGSPTDTSMDDVCKEEPRDMDAEEGAPSEDNGEEVNVDDEDKGVRVGDSPCSSESGWDSSNSVHQLTGVAGHTIGQNGMSWRVELPLASSA